MKATWSKFEILVTCLSVAIIPLAARLISIVFTLIFDPGSLLLTYLSLSSLFLVPLIGSAILVRFLKRRGKHVWPAATILAAVMVLLGLAGKYLSEFTRFVKLITGHYNAEANGFFLLMMLLMFGGALAGIGTGSLLTPTRSNLKSETTS